MSSPKHFEFYLNVVGYKTAGPAPAGARSSQFYLNVVGYKIKKMLNHFRYIQKFYLNVVGYKTANSIPRISKYNGFI